MRPSFSCALLGVVLLAGCASEPTAPAASQPVAGTPAAAPAAPAKPAAVASDRCSSDAVNDLLGRLADAAMLEQARQRAGAQRARLIEPEQMMTMDYDSQRLILYLDAQGKVSMITCG